MTYTRTSAEAKASRKELPRDAQEALLDVMDLLCDEPRKGRALAGGIRVYKHPDPPMQVIYRLDADADTVEFLDFAARIVRVARNVFVSYSHHDREWFEMVWEKLAVLEELGVHFWSDLEIEPASDWDQRIAERIDSSRAALLMVSKSFLESRYVRSREGPALLAKAGDTQGRFKLLWFLVSRCDLMADEMGKRIAGRQSLLPPTTPLASLRKHKRRAFLDELQREVARAVAI